MSVKTYERNKFIKVLFFWINFDNFTTYVGYNINIINDFFKLQENVRIDIIFRA